MMTEPATISITGRARAVTLTELLVVLAIMGILIGVGAPALRGYAASWRLKATTRELVGLLSLARSSAISAQEAHAVEVDPAGAQVRIVNVASGDALDQRLRIPAGVTIEARIGQEPAPEPKVVFRPSGGVDGRTTAFILSSRGREQTVTVMGTTGAISLE